MAILVENLSYQHLDKTPLFQDLNFTIPLGEKTALVGYNGTGKSTLLQLISNHIQSSAGNIRCVETPYYIPQHFGQYNDLSLAEVLGIFPKINALKEILKGNATVENFTILNDDWTVEERALEAFDLWKLKNYALSDKMYHLSGGEKTKVFLSGLFIHSPRIILMDEPSNHLDHSTRDLLYEFVKTTHSTLLAISHDKAFLDLFTTVYELDRGQIVIYGGDYTFYKRQKEIQYKALEAQLEEKNKQLHQTKKLASKSIERKQKLDARGSKKQKQAGIPKIMQGMMKNNAEQSHSKLKEVHIGKIENIYLDLRRIREQLTDREELKIIFQNTALHKGKILIEAENINIDYMNGNLWNTALSFQIRSGDRIHIKGDNGTGKTTLLKVILGEKTPHLGDVKKTEFTYLYVDQEYSLIEDKLTVYEQIQKLNKRNLSEHELKTLLYYFQFGAEHWDKSCKMLSGGERMKLLFCILMANQQAPDVFILDEPTNNLDIQSLNVITNVLKKYEGTLIVISHDRDFLKNIRLDNIIDLNTSVLKKSSNTNE